MTAQRLRPMPTAEQLATMYATPHDHRMYGRGHGERVEATIALARQTLLDTDRASVADLSCGNGEIARRIGNDLHLGDFAVLSADLPGVKYHGPIEATLDLLPDLVDCFVLSETLEHLDEPTIVLGRIREVARYLVLSTPLECWDDANGEHLWAWDRDGVEERLAATGWHPLAFAQVDSREYGEPYLYGIWVAG